MKITQEVRDYAASQKLSEAEALQKGMEAKAVEFVKQGAEIYKKAWGILASADKSPSMEVFGLFCFCGVNIALTLK